MESEKDIKLSKTILEMKFMKKTKEKVLKEQEDAEGQAMYSSEITEAMRKDGHIIFREASITQCKNLIEGRLSFGGMNPDVEKLMEKDYNKLILESERKQEKDVSDEQMAKEYSSIVDTVGNKFKVFSKCDHRCPYLLFAPSESTTIPSPDAACLYSSNPEATHPYHINLHQALR